GVDAEDRGVRGNEGPAPQAGVDGEVGLDPEVDFAPLPGAPLAARGADRAEGGSRAAVPGAAEGENQMPGAERRRVAEGCGGQLAGGDAEHGEVSAGVAALERGRE